MLLQHSIVTATVSLLAFYVSIFAGTETIICYCSHHLVLYADCGVPLDKINIQYMLALIEAGAHAFCVTQLILNLINIFAGCHKAHNVYPCFLRLEESLMNKIKLKTDVKICRQSPDRGCLQNRSLCAPVKNFYFCFPNIRL